MKFKILIPLLTLLTGFVAFSVIALCTNSFWFYSRCDVSLLKVPTLYIGDTIFLPLFNYFLYNLYLITRGEINYRKYKKPFMLYVGISLVLSFVINYFQHMAWASDKYTGWIDLENNKLSFGGWYHMSFASLQMTIMLILPWMFTVILKEKNIKGLNYSGKLFWIFFLYSCCAPFDALVKLRWVEGISNINTWIAEQIPAMKVFYTGLLLLVIYYLLKRKYLKKWIDP